MRKVTLSLHGIINDKTPDIISKSLNALSGIVAATVSSDLKTIIVFCGDKLTNETIISCITKEGYTADIINEDYMEDVYDLKQNLNL